MGAFDSDLDDFISETRKADKAEMIAAGGKIEYRGHTIEPDSECYTGYIVDGKRPDSWSAIEYAKAHIDSIEDSKPEGFIKFVQRILRARSLARTMKTELEAATYVSDPDDVLEVVNAFIDFFEYAQAEGAQREEKVYPRDPLYDPDEMPGHEGQTVYDNYGSDGSGGH